MKLKEEVVKIIRKDKELRSKLALGMGITESSLYRWLSHSDIRLTSALFLDIVAKHTKLDASFMILKEEREAINI